ncbi:sulfotransferase 1 family member D1-like [Plodia interpunctella]|uniref:sulfotransferase 1 family member D1-like n=1 Tax=Plodia interpunctella TaxID=58824 RepID=UPI002367CCE6|nr:sulfotransferase 1 family member D1-like [Plodia interpunctella]
MAEKKVPFKITDVPKELTAEFRKYTDGPEIEFVRVGLEKYRFPAGFREECVKVYNMELRPDDIFVVTFPKSGTTWTQELVWLIGNNFNYDSAAEKLLKERFPFLEYAMMTRNPKIEEWTRARMQVSPGIAEGILKKLTTSVVDVLNTTPSPRFIKTHLPFSLLPPHLLDTSKVVYVARDPRDVAVSYFHHCKLFKLVNFHGEFRIFWKMFLKDEFDWCPYFPHVKEAWAKRHHPNMLFLFYEELNKDLPAAVRRVAKFMNKPATEEQVQRLCRHLHIDNFRKNKSVNAEDLQDLGLANKTEHFIRKGKSGGWRDYFDEEMTRQAERWIEDNLRDTDLRFPTKD